MKKKPFFGRRKMYNLRSARTKKTYSGSGIVLPSLLLVYEWFLNSDKLWAAPGRSKKRELLSDAYIHHELLWNQEFFSYDRGHFVWILVNHICLLICDLCKSMYSFQIDWYCRMDFPCKMDKPAQKTNLRETKHSFFQGSVPFKKRLHTHTK